MKIRVSATDIPDTAAAMERLLAETAEAGRAPDFAALHLSVLHDPATAAAALRAAGFSRFHGGTSCLGVMSGQGMVAGGGAGAGLFAIWDAAGDYGTGRRPLGADPRAAAREAARAALDAAGRAGEAPDLVWLTSAPGHEEEIVAGIAEVVGPSTPIVGGSAADNDVSGRWQVFDLDGADGAGVIVSVLFPSRGLSLAYQNGYAPTGHAGRATRAEGRVLREIDGRPALEVYREWTGGAIAPAPAEGAVAILSQSTFSPLGRPVARVAEVPFYLLAHPATAHADGSIGLFADVAEGEELCLMSGSPESLASRAGRVAALAAEGAPAGSPPGTPAGALVVYCGGCMLAVRDRMDEVAAGIDSALGGAPFLGIFTFGEQGPVLGTRSRHGNLMISCVTFPG